jgi:hypothetical protein
MLPEQAAQDRRKKRCSAKKADRITIFGLKAKE